MSIDARDDELGTEQTGKLLQLPLNSVAGDAAAMRAELVALLRERGTTAVEEMVEALHRAGLAPILQVGAVPLAERLGDGVRIALAAWEHHRPLHATELDALADLGCEVARAGIPLWRLLSAVQNAARAGWQYALEHALALDPGHRPGTTAQLIGDLSVELFELVGRIEAQIAVGYGDTRGAPDRLTPRERSAAAR
jgi:hypothetical protein